MQGAFPVLEMEPAAQGIGTGDGARDGSREGDTTLSTRRDGTSIAKGWRWSCSRDVVGESCRAATLAKFPEISTVRMQMRARVGSNRLSDRFIPSALLYPVSTMRLGDSAFSLCDPRGAVTADNSGSDNPTMSSWRCTCSNSSFLTTTSATVVVD